jgi:nicotinamide mononucleotide transporter
MSWQTIIEIAVTAMNVLFLLMLMREMRMAWIWGGLASLFSIALFIDGKLYAEAILYLYYVGIAVYSFHRWKITDLLPIKIHEWNFLKTLKAILIGAAGTLMLGAFFSRYTDASYPYFDAFTTAFSFVATYMEARKIRSAWVWWFVLNLASARLYYLKDLNILAAQMVFFALLCIGGFIQWNRRMKMETT